MRPGRAIGKAIGLRHRRFFPATTSPGSASQAMGRWNERNGAFSTIIYQNALIPMAQADIMHPAVVVPEKNSITGP